MRKIETRFDVVRNGVRFAELKCRDVPVVGMVSDADIKMTLSGEFKPADINYLTDYIRPYLLVDGTAFPLGEYVVGTFREHLNGVTIEAFDKSLIVQQDALSERLSLPAGTPYTNAIQALLVGCGITNILCDASTAALQTVREDWEIGTDKLTVVNQLLAEINYNPLWFDMNGLARLHKYTAPSADRIDHYYKADEFSIIKPEYTRETDIFNACNVFIAMCSNPEFDEPLTATAINENPSSMLSTIRRGRRIVAPVIKVDNIASQEALQEYVDKIRNDSMISTETDEFTTALNPTHTVGDTVALDHEHLKGIFTETEWSLPMGAGELMTHKVRRVSYA